MVLFPNCDWPEINHSAAVAVRSCDRGRRPRRIRGPSAAWVGAGRGPLGGIGHWNGKRHQYRHPPCLSRVSADGSRRRCRRGTAFMAQEYGATLCDRSDAADVARRGVVGGPPRLPVLFQPGCARAGREILNRQQSGLGARLGTAQRVSQRQPRACVSPDLRGYARPEQLGVPRLRPASGEESHPGWVAVGAHRLVHSRGAIPALNQLWGKAPEIRIGKSILLYPLDRERFALLYPNAPSRIATIAGPGGLSFPVVPRRMDGWVDGVSWSLNVLRLEGWATTSDFRKLASRILVFVDGEAEESWFQRMPRPDVARGKPGIRRPGYLIDLAYRRPRPRETTRDPRLRNFRDGHGLGTSLSRELSPWGSRIRAGKDGLEMNRDECGRTAEPQAT